MRLKTATIADECRDDLCASLSIAGEDFLKIAGRLQDMDSGNHISLHDLQTIARRIDMIASSCKDYEHAFETENQT